MVHDIMGWVQIDHQKLHRLARECGQYEYSGRPLPGPLASDFVSATRRLTSIGHFMAANTGKLRSIILALEQSSVRNHFLKQEKEEASDLIQTSTGDRVSAILNARVDYLRDTCNTLLLEAKYEKSQLDGLCQAVSLYLPSF
jgi:hypothetical protein